MLRFILAAVVVAVLGVATSARAALVYLGEGTSSTFGTHSLIYDTDLNVTWFDFTQTYLGGTWYNQTAWAANLSVSINGDNFNGWRLPMTVQPDPNASDHGLYWDPVGTQSDYGYNCLLSEMGHLFYVELGNAAGTLTQTGDFENIVPYGYWSVTDYAVPDPDYFAWTFNLGIGYQSVLDKGYYGLFAMAVHDGLVPEPTCGLVVITLVPVLLRRRTAQR